MGSWRPFDLKKIFDSLPMYFSVALGFGAASFVVYWSPVPMFFAPLGASTCILFTAPTSENARWYHVVLSHFLCALIGVTVQSHLGRGWLACAVCVTAAIAAMDIADVMHPPAAATSLIGFTTDQGYMFALMPTLSGMCALVAVSKTVLFLLGRLKTEPRAKK